MPKTETRTKTVRVAAIRKGMRRLRSKPQWEAIEDAKQADKAYGGHITVKVMYLSDGSYGWRHWANPEKALELIVPAEPAEQAEVKVPKPKSVKPKPTIKKGRER